MIKIFKKFKFVIISFIVLSLGLITISYIPTHKDLIVPAEAYNIQNTYQFAGIDTKDVHVYSVSVYSYYNVTLSQYLFSLLNPYAVISEHNDIVNTSSVYINSSGTVQKNVSLINALIAGYKESGKDISYTFLGNIIHSLYGTANRYFQVSDVINEVEGEKITKDKDVNNILLEKYGYIQIGDYYYINLELNKPYQFKVLRNGEVIDVEAYCMNYQVDDNLLPILGINYYNYNSINKEETNPKFEIKSPDTYGPSAGLMQSLFIYDALSGEKLTKNLIVAGTGTIDEDGRVGSIGGVQSKLTAAIQAKADVFFCPASNYIEAKERFDKLNYKTKMKLVSVNTLHDCIEYLKENMGGI